MRFRVPFFLSAHGGMPKLLLELDFRNAEQTVECRRFVTMGAEQPAQHRRDCARPKKANSARSQSIQIPEGGHCDWGSGLPESRRTGIRPAELLPGNGVPTKEEMWFDQIVGNTIEAYGQQPSRCSCETVRRSEKSNP